ncbi:hypothetical protein [uncultured Treponema sp.]|uniref:hypothetical protein n=1 Tax=uncultured Treponema sp. TaxID=162155 RepID=UPI002598EC1D|nr:hypothetical protein [uncultured Treponema sp.]
MFEKEAKEYATENYENCVYDDFSYTNDSKAIERSFKDGAEFGYNKANEWHKQDIDDIYDLISKDWDIRYFICIMKDKSRVTAIGNCDEGCNGEVSVNLFFEHDDEKYYMDDIVWWKEIVPPKEIKENG